MSLIYKKNAKKGCIKVNKELIKSKNKILCTSVRSVNFFDVEDMKNKLFPPFLNFNKVLD